MLGELQFFLLISYASYSTSEIYATDTCPETPTCSIGEAGTLKPYPPDCTKYIYCNELGEAQLSLCQFELHFNADLGLCVPPEDSNCQNCGGEFTPEGTIAVCDNIKKCSLEGELLPFPPDCTKYIYCDGSEWGVLSLCGLDQHFSPTLLRCLPILEANCPICQEIILPTTPNNNEYPTSDIITPEIIVCEEIQKCNIEGELLPYPPDCRKYIYCDGTESGEISVCPLVKHFSPSVRDCLPSEEANCPFCEEM